MQVRFIKIITAIGVHNLETEVNQFLATLSPQEQKSATITVNPYGMQSANVVYDTED